MRLSNLLRDDCRVQNNFVRLYVDGRSPGGEPFVRTLNPVHESGTTERISNIALRETSIFGWRIEINIFQGDNSVETMARVFLKLVNKPRKLCKLSMYYANS